MADPNKFTIFPYGTEEELRIENTRDRQPERGSQLTLVIPENWQEKLPWPEIPSPSMESFKEREPVERPPLHKDRRRVIVFIGLMLAWLFVCTPETPPEGRTDGYNRKDSTIQSSVSSFTYRHMVGD